MGGATLVSNENNFLEVPRGLSLSLIYVINLCSGGTKNFVELWQIILLNI